jgi:hypothetical protein
MIYALYWKETNKRYNSNTNPLLFASKKGANGYIKNQKSFGLSTQLISKPFAGRTVYNVVNKATGDIWFGTFEREIAYQMVNESRDGVMGVATYMVKITRPKTIFAVVSELYSKILYVSDSKEWAKNAVDTMQSLVNEEGKVIKIK